MSSQCELAQFRFVEKRPDMSGRHTGRVRCELVSLGFSTLKLIGLWERPVWCDRTCLVGPEQLWELSGLYQMLHLLRSVRCDRTCPVGPEWLLELSRLDRTLSFLRSVVHTGCVRS